MDYLNIIIPVKNEEGNIVPLVKRIASAMSSSGINYTIIFVDDRSEDKTADFIFSLQKFYSVKLIYKQGKPGKAYSIIEGVKAVEGEYFAMIDGDLQYPPEAIPEMFRMLSEHGVVVANRVDYNDKPIRKLLNSAFRNIFGKFLFGLKCDVQSGLKLFKREVIEALDENKLSAWTIDLPLLLTARELGYTIGSFDIKFDKREYGNSSISIVKTSLEIGARALKTKFSSKKVYKIKPESNESMLGSGIAHKGSRFVTHTTLNHNLSAFKTFHLYQKLAAALLLFYIASGLFLNWLLTLQIIIGALSLIYFIDALFSLFLITKSLHSCPELNFTKEELDNIDQNTLPIYSILCPLYKEAAVVPNFIKAISKLDWPKNKLDVQLLLEEDDLETINKVKGLTLPDFIKTTIVPLSQPKTKPKACNYGLAKARGDLIVIYDAEDIPDSDQLKKAYLAFSKLDQKTVCLQAKLNYFNPHQNLLTRLFTAEYSLWFDVMLTGFQAINTTIPLGGTSNHFKISALRELEGWDPFNVTEDCDLGVRLFKKGYKTAIIESTTLEEANSNLKNWLRQRSRWIKGYLQTYLVHSRDDLKFLVSHKHHALIFQLIIGARISFLLINPILWALTISYFTLYAIVGPTIESFYPAPVFYMAIFSLVFGNFMYVYNYMIGCAKKGQYSLIKYIYLIPLYWLMASFAAVLAIYQLIFKPHYWEKTVHGFHLDKKQEQQSIAFPYNLRHKLIGIIAGKKTYIGGMAIVVASMVANILNFIFNAFLGRVLDFKDFALIGLLGAFVSFSSVLLNAFTTTANFRSGFLIGKYGENAGFSFWQYLQKKAFIFSVLITTVWLFSTPFLMKYFNVDNPFLFIFFGAILLVGFINGANSGFLSSHLMFGTLAFIDVLEPAVKMLTAASLVWIGLGRWAFSAIPLSIIVAFLAGWLILVRQIKEKEHDAPGSEIQKFPKKFFAASLLTAFSSVAFLTVDILLANHFLPQAEAGKYALLSLVGKMVFFLGALTSPFMIPLVSREEGAKRNSDRILKILLLATVLLSLGGFFTFGVLGGITIPMLYGAKASAIVPNLLFFTFGMACYSISKVFVDYYLVKRVYSFTVFTSLLVLIQIGLIQIYHRDAGAIALVTSSILTIHLIVTLSLHSLVKYLRIFENNLSDILALFGRIESPTLEANRKLRILIFNWRDIKHKWAGGAEVYIHELAKRWIQEGSYVAIFSGNDGKSMKNEVIDGIQIYRRGGFYMVYLWAFLYYMFKFRGKFDVIIDSENGVPFFTPLYAKEKKFLLIHHVHQEVFLTDLKFPLAQIGKFLEGEVMPLIYKKEKIITVSESSRQAITELGMGKQSEISIVSPGVDLEKFQTKFKKSTKPSLLYLGRLKPYKSIDKLILIMKKIKKEIPEITLTIAGAGESKVPLKRLVKKLRLSKIVKFTGSVSEKSKIELFAKSWALVQPSKIEGWGITIIEAYAAGTTVIASDVPGLRDSVLNPHTGLLVTWDNQEKWIEAICKVLKDEEFRISLEEYSKQWVKQFSWEKSSGKLMKILEF